MKTQLSPCKGFINIDALDGDIPTLRRLQALRLYRFVVAFFVIIEVLFGCMTGTTSAAM